MKRDSSEKNIGLQKANLAGQKYGAKVVIPNFHNLNLLLPLRSLHLFPQLKNLPENIKSVTYNFGHLAFYAALQDLK